MCDVKVFTKNIINTKWELKGSSRLNVLKWNVHRGSTDALRVHAGIPLIHSHNTRLLCFACVAPAASSPAAVRSQVMGASGWSHRSSCDNEGTQKTLQLSINRLHNPRQAVVLVYEGHSVASSLLTPLSLSCSLALEGMYGGREE